MSCCNKKKSRWKLTVWLAVVLGVASFAILSDASGEPATAGSEVAGDSGVAGANAMCPVTTDEKIDPDIATTYNGREVYFCCQRCKRKFERDPETYVDNLPAGYFVSAASGAESHAHGDDAHRSESPTPGPASATGGESGGHGHGEQEAAHSDERSSSSADGHDHSAHEQAESEGLFMRFIGWLGRFHPPSVNFPIALMTAALVAEGLFMATGRPLFDAAGRFTVWFAIVGTVGAVILGWFFGGFKLTDDDWIMTTHRWVGTAAGIWAFVLAWFASKAWVGPKDNPPRGRVGYRFALVIGTVLVSTNGFFGGALMYGIDHYLW